MCSESSFFDRVRKRWSTSNTLVCVGLDSEYSRLPESIRLSKKTKKEEVEASLFQFNKEIIDSTADLVCCYKLQIAFYAAEDLQGLMALKSTIGYIKEKYPDIPIILDAKRSDIGSTTEKYVIEIFKVYNADGVTLSPLLGRDACEPFLRQSHKGLFFLCHTSNPGASEFQEVQVTKIDGAGIEKSMSLYLFMAMKIAKEWNKNKNCGLVVGATFPEQLYKVRDIAGDIPLLIPGIGAQQGDVKETIISGRDSQGHGMIISSSRSIIYASNQSDFSKAAYNATKELRDQINSYL